MKTALYPVFWTESDELYIRCRKWITLLRVWIAGSGRGLDALTPRSGYHCPHCDYEGSHDYPYFLRQNQQALELIFVPSASYEQRWLETEPSRGFWQRLTRWRRTDAGPASAWRQCAETLAILRVAASNAAFPWLLQDFRVHCAASGPGNQADITNALETRSANALVAEFRPQASGGAREDWVYRQANRVLSAMTDLARQEAALGLAVTRGNHVEVARICTDVLATSLVMRTPDQVLTFALNMAWALVVSPEARTIVMPDEASSIVKSALDRLAAQGPSVRLASGYNNYGSLLLLTSQPPKERNAAAIRAYEHAIALYRSVDGDHRSEIAHVLLHYAAAVRSQPSGDRAENVETAIDLSRKAGQLFADTGDQAGQARALHFQGVAYFNRIRGSEITRLREACQCFTEALGLWNELELPTDILEERIMLSATQLELGRQTGDTQLIKAGWENAQRALDDARASNSHFLAPALHELLIACQYRIATGAPEPTPDDAVALCDELDTLWGDSAEGRAHSATHRSNFAILTAQCTPTSDGVDRAVACLADATKAWATLGMREATIDNTLTTATLLMREKRYAEAEVLLRQATSDARNRMKVAVSLAAESHRSREIYRSHHLLASCLAHNGNLIQAVDSLDAALAINLRDRSHLAAVPEELRTVAAEYARRLAMLERHGFSHRA